MIDELMAYKARLLAAPIAHENFDAVFRLAWAYVNAPQMPECPPEARRMLVLVGPTGVGKSCLVGALCEALARQCQGGVQASIPSVHVTAQLTKANGMNFRETYIHALQKMSEPLIDRKVIANINELPELKDARRCYARATEAAYRDALIQAMINRSTQLFVLDDGQELLRTKAMLRLCDPLVTMRGLVDSVSCRIMLAGVYEMLEVWATSAHLMRRSRLIEFGRYKQTEAGLKGFVAVLKALDRRAPLSNDSYAAHADWLWTLSYGCSGMVIDVIADALDVAIQNGDKKFAWRNILAVPRLQVHIEKHKTEVDEGEKLLAEFRGAVANEGDTHRKRRTLPRVGKRNPSRDKAFGVARDD